VRAVVQRVTNAAVRVDHALVGSVGSGLLVLVGVAAGDTRADAEALANKIANLRIFDQRPGNAELPAAGEPRRMDGFVLDVGGDVLCVSQFTLYGDCRKGRRPGYDRAATPEVAEPLYDHFVEVMRSLLGNSPGRVATGQFRAMMTVESVNDGPVTLLLDSERNF
jgi:D-tyrosyl-tRNA(Tyr) deacylase